MTTISGSGASIVWNNPTNQTLTYVAKGATVANTKTGTSTSSPEYVEVYLNLKNPESASRSLAKVSGQIDTNKATIDKVTVYFGKDKIYGSAPNLDYDQDFKFSVDQAGAQADNKSAGICVTLKLKFVDPSASITISSVSLEFAG